MSQLRERAPVLKGSLRELLDLPPMPHDYSAHRQQYTLFSYKICESAFRDNQTFSSEIYRDSPGVQSLGRTILEMVGDEHRRYRNVVQPMFLRDRTSVAQGKRVSVRVYLVCRRSIQ